MTRDEPLAVALSQTTDERVEEILRRIGAVVGEDGIAEKDRWHGEYAVSHSSTAFELQWEWQEYAIGMD